MTDYARLEVKVQKTRVGTLATWTDPETSGMDFGGANDPALQGDLKSISAEAEARVDGREDDFDSGDLLAVVTWESSDSDPEIDWKIDE